MVDGYNSTVFSINDVDVSYEGVIPFSLEVEANTTVCVAETSGAKEDRWLVDDMGCAKEKCEGYENGCYIYMDAPHTAAVTQHN